MRTLLLQILALGYTSIGFVSIAGYWPTIKDLYIRKKQSANSASYVIWTATSAIAFFYSIFLSSDMRFQFVSGVNFVCSTVILLLSVWLVSTKPVSSFPNNSINSSPES